MAYGGEKLKGGAVVVYLYAYGAVGISDVILEVWHGVQKIFTFKM